MTALEDQKLPLNFYFLKSGLDKPEILQDEDAEKAALKDEIKTLRRNNGRLQQQVSSLKDQNQELEDYAHTVAHNLKNPLSVLILTSDAIIDIGDLSRQELKEYLQQIRSTAYEMNDTVDNLLLLSEVRKVDILAGPVDMARVVTSIRKRLHHLIKQYNGALLAPKEWPSALGYAPWIEEVWVNYVSNALKYGGRPPVVRLGASEQPDGMISFWVLDNGFGIPAEVQDSLFLPFNQFSKHYRPGHGLGLSIVRHIVEKLDGKVGVQSKAGKGSLFFFTLPANHPGDGRSAAGILKG